MNTNPMRSISGYLDVVGEFTTSTSSFILSYGHKFVSNLTIIARSSSAHHNSVSNEPNGRGARALERHCPVSGPRTPEAECRVATR